MLLKTARKLGIAIVGGTVVLVGCALFFLPGPGLLVALAGFAILATEFVFFARLLRQLRRHARAFGEKTGLYRPAAPIRPPDPLPGAPAAQPGTRD